LSKSINENNRNSNTAMLLAVTLGMAQAELRQSTERNRNYILTAAGSRASVRRSTTRRIIGKREIELTEVLAGLICFSTNIRTGILPKLPPVARVRRSRSLT
jgi:hypothetical protein